MRLTYYQFPEDTPLDVLEEHGCEAVLKDGTSRSLETLSEEGKKNIESIDTTISCSISSAKKLLKKYGGAAWTEHIDRDGGCFEVTPVELSGNNSRFKYNHHL